MRNALSITPKQRDFLASYLPDICSAEHKWLERADRSQFVEAVRKMDFDGQVAPSDVRVARSLNTKGLFATFDLHHDLAGQPCAYVRFSVAGAEAVYDLLRRGEQQRASGRSQEA